MITPDPTELHHVQETRILTRPSKGSQRLPQDGIRFLRTLLKTGIPSGFLPTVSEDDRIRPFGEIPTLTAAIFNAAGGVGRNRMNFTSSIMNDPYIPVMLNCPLPQCFAEPLNTEGLLVGSRKSQYLNKGHMRIRDIVPEEFYDNLHHLSQQPESPLGRTCAVLYTSTEQCHDAHTIQTHMSHFGQKRDADTLWDTHGMHYHLMLKILDDVFAQLLLPRPPNRTPIENVYIPLWIDLFTGEKKSSSKHRFLMRIYQVSPNRFSIQYIVNHQDHPIPTNNTCIILTDIPWWKNTPQDI